MGTSALVSAVTALPWDQEECTTDEEGDADSEFSDDGHISYKDMARTMYSPARPKRELDVGMWLISVPRMHSSLHTIRAMEPSPSGEAAASQSPSHRLFPHRHRATAASPEEGQAASPATGHRHHVFPHHSLDFPYRENVISRRAREPLPTELEYQFAPEVPEAAPPPPDRVSSAATLRTLVPSESPQDASVVSLASTTPPIEGSTSEAEDIELQRRARMEQLGVLLQEVFGLEEQEEVIDELPCWLLRNDSECQAGDLTNRSAQGLHVPDQAAYLLLRAHARG